MSQVTGRALHYVLKVGNLKKNVEFFRDKLRMTVLRHEVFEKGCEAACNGPYDGKWSKTMIGYGPEDEHFVLELTYNYSIGAYKLGNDLRHISISLEAGLFDQIKRDFASSPPTSSPEDQSNRTDQLTLHSPDGYKFLVSKAPQGATGSVTQSKNDITEVCLSVSDLNRSLNYWRDLLNMKQTSDGGSVLRYSQGNFNQATLRLEPTTGGSPIDHKSAYGRIAFSCVSDQLKPLQKMCQDQGHKILTPYVSLDTPGKATVQVIILADPDGHEICFVGDEGFRQLSQVDPAANNLIEKSMLEDKSDEWFQKKNRTKEEAQA